MTVRTLGTWSTIVLLPLVPVLLLYWLFSDQNFFELKDAAKGIVATGPVAAYIFLVWTLWKIYPRVAALTGEVSPLQAKILGTWDFASMSGSGTKREGSCSISEQHGLLELSGNFVQDAKNVGSWESKMAQIDGQRFEVLYRLDEVSEDGPQQSTGVLSVHIDSDNLKQMTGNWMVLGRGSQGNIVLTRRA
jgi:hypothetical protein